MCAYFKEEMIKNKRGYTIPSLSDIDDSDKMILLCVRGFGGGRYSGAVEKLARALKPLGTGVFSFTWPGHGISDVGGEMLKVDNCLKDMEEVVELLIARHQEKRLCCFATSFGGYMSIIYHQKHPDVFDKIILRSPAVNMAEIVFNFASEEQKEALYRGEKLDFGFENPLLLGIEFYEDLKRHDVTRMILSRPEKFSIIQGDCDEIVPPDEVQKFAGLNHLPVCWIEGADHQYTNPGGSEAMVESTLRLLSQN